jgi:hypothetical protein
VEASACAVNPVSYRGWQHAEGAGTQHIHRLSILPSPRIGGIGVVFVIIDEPGDAKIITEFHRRSPQKSTNQETGLEGFCEARVLRVKDCPTRLADCPSRGPPTGSPAEPKATILTRPLSC